MRTEPTVDSAYAWGRLAASLAISTIGGIGLWSAVIVLPSIEAEFGVGRGGASIPYAATMVGFAAGGVLMGRIADRIGIMLPLIFGTLILGVGFAAAALTHGYWEFVLCQSLLIGMIGSSTTFGPMVADVSHWFLRYRGIAVAVVASGNYAAGAIWPPLLTRAIQAYGWRDSYLVIAAIVVVTMVPLSLLLRRRAAIDDGAHPVSAQAAPVGAGMARAAPPFLQVILIVAGISCCIAMSMPQVHTIAYCVDLGYGPTRGSDMLSVMLAMGVVSRLGSGFIADRIGGVGTLILGSMLQCLTLFFYLPFTGPVSLYVVSALFGLSQGGIVPSYALIVRQYFPAREAGVRVSLVLMATVVGMAIGGWITGEIRAYTGSYQVAFLNGIAFNLLNMAIAGWLLMRQMRVKVLAA